MKHLTPTHQGCLGPKTQQEPFVSVTIESDKSTQHPPAPSTTDLASFPTSPPDIRHLTEMVTNLQVKVADLEQEVLDQKCLHKSHIKVLQAQIFDLEANTKTLSDKLASLADSQQTGRVVVNKTRKERVAKKAHPAIQPPSPLIHKILPQALTAMGSFHPVTHINPLHTKTHLQNQRPTSV